MLSKTKKAVILAGMLLLLVVTGYLNVVLNSTSTPAAEEANTTQLTFFEGYRVMRTEARNESILIWTATAENESLSAEARAEAEAEILELGRIIQKELAIESIIKSQGFEEVVVSLSSENINVIVQCDEGADNLTKSQVAQILDIVMEQTGEAAVNIHIIPV